MKIAERKKLENIAYNDGIKGFNQGFNCAPHNNREFMITVPHCAFGDTTGTRLRAKLFQSYINGWTFANLNQPCE